MCVFQIFLFQTKDEELETLRDILRYKDAEEVSSRFL